MQPAVLIFDLDDTLYLERDFALSGFKAADEWLRRENGTNGLFDVCRHLFDTGDRTRIFDQALAALGIAADPPLVDLLIDIYRTHQPTITLAPDAERFLSRNAGAVWTGLITDGPVGTQQAKVRALGLEDRLGCIIYTDALGPDRKKPHPHAYELQETWAQPSGLRMVYIADNPLKDFVTPRARGWLTVKLARPERVHRVEAPDAAHQAHVEITTLDQLDDCLSRLQHSDPLAAT